MKYVVAHLAVLLVACGKENPAPAPQSAPAAPVEVGVITVEAKPITLTRELPGRLSPIRVAEVRARVNGIVLQRLFTEGADVARGQKLFVIDPAPYQATLESARAQLVRAKATVASANSLAERYAKLIATNAVSRQEYDNAVAQSKAAEAEVAAARAAVKAAEINVGYTTVRAPIAGRIGRSEVTEGAFVQQGTATLLATVQQLDPMYVDLTWSSSELLAVRRAVEAGELDTVGGKASIAVVLEDGRDYAERGTLEFTGVSVDESTGSVLLRAIVPNPRGELLPGMFVRARIEEGTKPDAILVQQRAVTRDPNGSPFVLVVDNAGKAERRAIETNRTIGDSWLVTKGLRPGEQVIVEGLQKVRPGAAVKAVPAAASQRAER